MGGAELAEASRRDSALLVGRQRRRAEGETPVKLVCRSLQVLRLELHATRLASSTKLRQEWERRVEGNARAVDVLESNSHLWRHVGGLAPERFRKPTQGELCAAAGAVASLRRLLRRRKEAGQPDDGLETYAEEIIGAVGMLRIVSWELQAAPRWKQAGKRRTLPPPVPEFRTPISIGGALAKFEPS